MASRGAIAAVNKTDKFFRRIGSGRFREGGSGKLPAVVVRTSDENFLPRFRVRRRKIVAIHERVDFIRRQSLKKSLGQIAKERIAQAVDRLEMLKQKDELLEMACLEFSVHAVKRVRNCVRDLRGLQVALQVEDVIADSFDVAMLLL